MQKHLIGTHVEMRNRYVRVKVGSNKWEGLGRHLLKNSGVAVGEGDRVFFADGDRNNRSVENLRRIHFNTRPIVLLAHSRVIYTPRRSVNDQKHRLTNDVIKLVRKRAELAAA